MMDFCTDRDCRMHISGTAHTRNTTLCKYNSEMDINEADKLKEKLSKVLEQFVSPVWMNLVVDRIIQAIREK